MRIYLYEKKTCVLVSYREMIGISKSIFMITQTLLTVVQTDNIASVLMLIIITDFSYDGQRFQPWIAVLTLLQPSFVGTQMH